MLLSLLGFSLGLRILWRLRRTCSFKWCYSVQWKYLWSKLQKTYNFVPVVEKHCRPYIFFSRQGERMRKKTGQRERKRENWKIRGGREKVVQLQCSSWRTTGSPSSSLEMTILRNKSQDETIRVSLGIFTTALWNEKLKSNSHEKIPHLTFTMPCYIIKLKMNYSRKWVLSNLVGGQITSNAMW